MILREQNKQEIKQAVSFFINGEMTKSIYLKKDDVIIRISDHLPNFNNFERYNDEKKLILICVGVKEHVIIDSIDAFIEDNEDDYNYNDVIGYEVNSIDDLDAYIFDDYQLKNL